MPGIWPATLHGVGVLLVVCAILLSGAPSAWKTLLTVAAGYVCWLDWRYRPRCISLAFDRTHIRAELAGGAVLFAEAPFASRIAPGFVSIRFRTRWRDRWLTLFSDQLPGDVMRRLRRVLLHGARDTSG